MSDTKGSALDAYNSDRPEEGYEMTDVSRLGGTDQDAQEMAALGKVQVLNVRPALPGFTFTICLDRIKRIASC